MPTEQKPGPAPDNDEHKKRESLPKNQEGKIERYNNQTETKESWRSNGREPE